jgi:hypothetical protein
MPASPFRREDRAVWTTGPAKQERDGRRRREDEAFSTGSQIVACLWVIALLLGIFEFVWWVSGLLVSS